MDRSDGTKAGLHSLKEKLLFLHFSFPLPTAWNVDVVENSDANKDKTLKDYTTTKIPIIYPPRTTCLQTL